MKKYAIALFLVLTTLLYAEDYAPGQAIVLMKTARSVSEAQTEIDTIALVVVCPHFLYQL